MSSHGAIDENANNCQFPSRTGKLDYKFNIERVVYYMLWVINSNIMVHCSHLLSSGDLCKCIYQVMVKQGFDNFELYVTAHVWFCWVLFFFYFFFIKHVTPQTDVQG